MLNTYRNFANDSEREGISRYLQETEDWLYEDGVDESEDVYVQKLEDLMKVTQVWINFFVVWCYQFPQPINLFSYSLLILLKTGTMMKKQGHKRLGIC